MAKTLSNMLPLGTQAPDFTLKDTNFGKMVSLHDLKSPKATVILFICNHCPFVHHVNAEIVALAKDYQPQKISFIAINANNPITYPEDSPEKMTEIAQKLGYTFPYLFDETQDIAKAYKAACTPDFYIFDKNLACVYRGQLDDSRPGNDIPVTGKDIRQALDALLMNQPVDVTQKPSIGCNIKWK